MGTAITTGTPTRSLLDETPPDSTGPGVFPLGLAAESASRFTLETERAPSFTLARFLELPSRLVCPLMFSRAAQGSPLVVAHRQSPTITMTTPITIATDSEINRVPKIRSLSGEVSWSPAAIGANVRPAPHAAASSVESQFA